MKVYFDESGQSGAHLLDAEQPYFALGSTNIEPLEASGIIARCFPRRQGAELKSQNVLRRDAGRRGFLELAREVGRTPDRFCAVKVGKVFSVLAKMVDNLVEPMLRAQGFDFYEGDYAVQFANHAHFAFTRVLDPASARDVLERYNAFGRAPDREGLRALDVSLAAAIAVAPTGAAPLLGMMRDGTRLFEALHDLDTWSDNNDLHVTAAITCMGHWQGVGPGPYEVVHDESTHFFRRSERWWAMTDPDLAPMVLELGTKSLRLPIGVVSTTSARSHECASLQLCDLVAGFVTRASAPAPARDFQDFVRDAVAAGMGELNLFPIDAGTEFPDGPPRRATGPDIVDRIAMAVRSRDGGGTSTGL